MPKRKDLTSIENSPEEETVKKQKRVSFTFLDTDEPSDNDCKLVSQPVEPASNKTSPKRKKGKRKKSSTAVRVKSTDTSSLTSKRDAALGYLQQWHTDRTKWSFKKKQQLWLLQNVYDKTQIDKKSFKLLVGYVEGLQGAQRSKLVEEANTRVENYKPQQEEKEGESIVLQYQYNRAVELMRVLA